MSKGPLVETSGMTLCWSCCTPEERMTSLYHHGESDCERCRRCSCSCGWDGRLDDDIEVCPLCGDEVDDVVSSPTQSGGRHVTDEGHLALESPKENGCTAGTRPESIAAGHDKSLNATGESQPRKARSNERAFGV